MQTVDKLDDRFDRITISTARPRFIHDTRGYLTLSDVFDAARGHASRARSLIEYLRTLRIRSKVNVACTEYLVVIYSSRWNIRIEGGRFFFDRIFTTRVDDDQAVVDIRIRRESFNAIRRFIALSASSATWRGLGSLSRPSHPIFDARKTGVAVSD